MMGCERKIITLDAAIGTFTFRNQVTIHQFGVWANGVDAISININDIPQYQGVASSVPTGIELTPSVQGFVFIPCCVEAIRISFDTGLDIRALLVVEFSEN